MHYYSCQIAQLNCCMLIILEGCRCSFNDSFYMLNSVQMQNNRATLSAPNEGMKEGRIKLVPLPFHLSAISLFP